MDIAPALDTDLQRSSGSIEIAVGAHGALERLREEGCAKLRMPARVAGSPHEAVLINTSGGLAGGDRVDVDIVTARDICSSAKSAVNVHRSLDSETRVDTTPTVRHHSRSVWRTTAPVLA